MNIPWDLQKKRVGSFQQATERRGLARLNSVWCKSFARKASLSLAMICAGITSAAAGPEGLYFTKGVDDDGTEYVGTVSIVRTGETYRILWRLADTVYRGAGLGAAPLNGATKIGPASSDDDVLTVGFTGTTDKSGVAFFVEQSDGSWHGIWTQYGSHNIATETWTPVPPLSVGPGLF
ncbi:MAG: hypothetical protein AAF940_00225 [Pseudomonadota bacterium]